MAGFRTNNNVIFSCKYHVIWCSKYRKEIITEALSERLTEIIQEVCKERNAKIIALETMPDHVQLLVDVDPQFGIHKLVKQIKGRSSRLLRQEFPIAKSRLPSLWTNSYFVATSGRAPLKTIKQYIEQQKYV